MQASCSASCGSRFCGGLHFTILAIYIFLCRSKSTAFNILSNNLPPLPTNGSPCKSSFSPGPSPIKRTSAFLLPTPKTTLCRVLQRSHRSQLLQSRSSSSKDLYIPQYSFRILPNSHGSYNLINSKFSRIICKNLFNYIKNPHSCKLSIGKL